MSNQVRVTKASEIPAAVDVLRYIIRRHVPGEMVYRGKNVAMGYAVCGGDLARGDDWHGGIRTGGIAERGRGRLPLYHRTDQTLAFQVVKIDAFPTNETGKVLYGALQEETRRHIVL